MIALQSENGPAELPFSDEDFARLARFAKSEFGLNLSPAKKPLVYSRLSKRLRALSLTTFHAYLEAVEQTSDQGERLELISALTTNVTSFFRERHHFDTLRGQVLEPMFSETRVPTRLRIWSAGCSSGQEAYSIAMTILDCKGFTQSSDAKILATDIDPRIVERARRAQYGQEETATLPNGFAARFMEASDAASCVRPEVRKMVTFGELNLIGPWPIKGPFDAIFCRNVAIYFEQATQQELWHRFTQMLRPGGFLFIGHSERVTGPAAQTLKVAGVTTYRKPGPTSSAGERTSA